MLRNSFLFVKVSKKITREILQNPWKKVLRNFAEFPEILDRFR
jgi:hypothetical protein